MKVSKSFRRYQSYSEEVKRDVVKLCFEGTLPRTTIMRRYGITSYTVLYRWIEKYGDCILSDSIQPHPMDQPLNASNLDTEGDKEQSDNKRIKELEEQLRRASLKVDLLERMIDIAEDELKVPIRKKSGPQQSTKSKKKNK